VDKVARLLLLSGLADADPAAAEAGRSAAEPCIEGESRRIYRRSLRLLGVPETAR